VDDGDDSASAGANGAAAPTSMDIDSDADENGADAKSTHSSGSKSQVPVLPPLPTGLKLHCPIPAQYLQYLLTPRIVRLLVQSISGHGPLEPVARHVLSVITNVASQDASVALAIVGLLVSVPAVLMERGVLIARGVCDRLERVAISTLISARAARRCRRSCSTWMLTVFDNMSASSSASSMRYVVV